MTNILISALALSTAAVLLAKAVVELKSARAKLTNPAPSPTAPSAISTANQRTRATAPRWLVWLAIANIAGHVACFGLLLWFGLSAPDRPPTIRETALLLLTTANIVTLSRPFPL